MATSKLETLRGLIETALATITTGNGYNNTVKTVTSIPPEQPENIPSGLKPHVLLRYDGGNVVLEDRGSHRHHVMWLLVVDVDLMQDDNPLTDLYSVVDDIIVCLDNHTWSGNVQTSNFGNYTVEYHQDGARLTMQYFTDYSRSRGAAQ